MSAPQRIQLSRAKGWRKPDGAIVVSRPGRWGNPFTYSDIGAQFPSLDDRQVGNLVVRHFRELVQAGRIDLPNWRYLGGHRGRFLAEYPSVDEIRAELAGHDLACWCDLDEPCHADVLLRVAAGGAA